jgi:inorganic phosphate transporter, PiT family
VSPEQAGLLALFILAFVNGANDVGKSVVSLMIAKGPISAAGNRPLIWGGIFSGIGSVAAIAIAGRLFSVFSPSTLVTPQPAFTFALAALVGTSAWLLLATIVRIPVSTTHAIVGAVVLQAVFFYGISSLAWTVLAERVVLPLFAGPFVALIGAYILDRFTRGRQSLEPVKPAKFRLAHYGSAAATSFARGVNDAPKMVALGAFLLPAASAQSGISSLYLIVVVAVFAGSLIWGDRVAITIAGRDAITGQGHRAKAGFATAALVTAGAYFGEALSTTHMSQGADAGAGGQSGRYVRSVLKSIILAWLVTFPAAGALAVFTALFGARIFG